MSKYNDAKFLKETKARMVHICDKCGKQIEGGEIYYPESIGRINAPGIKLKKFCKDCFQKYGDKLLQKDFWRRASFAGTKFGGGTPEAIPLLRDATGQEVRAGPEGETSFPYGVNKNSCFLLAP